MILPDGQAGSPESYQAPGGFDRSDCPLADWTGLALAGTFWTTEVTLPDRKGPIMIRFDRENGVLVARTEGVVTEPILQNATDLFFWHPVGPGHSQQSFLVCAQPAAGILDGKMALCGVLLCETGTFHAVKLERRAGEGAAPASPGLTLLAEYGDFPGSSTITANVRVDAARSLAVLARFDDGMRILGLAPGPPYLITPLGHGVTESGAASELYNDVKLLDVGGRNYALMASTEHGLVIWDITQPGSPAVAAHVRDGDNVHTDFVVGTTVYLADLSLRGLLIADLSEPTAPRELGQFIPPRSGAAEGADVFVHDLYVQAGRAYLDSWGAGLLIVDVTDPTHPRALGQFVYPRATNHSVWVTTLAGRTIALTGDEDFDAHARELDVTDPAAIQLVGEWGQDRPEVSIHNILIDGDTAYVAHYMDGLRILALSATAPPAQIGYFNTWMGDFIDGNSAFEGAIGVDKVGSLVYVADERRGLMVVELR